MPTMAAIKQKKNQKQRKMAKPPDTVPLTYALEESHLVGGFDVESDQTDENRMNMA